MTYSPSIRSSWRIEVALRTLTIVARRLIYAIPVLVGITAVVFFLTSAVPGDVAETILGSRASHAQLAALRHQEGLDRPVLARYWLYLTHVVRGDLGYSPLLHESVGSAIASAAPVTLFLVCYALALALIVAFPLALLAAARSGRLTDRAVRGAVIAGMGLPSYWVGVLLVTYVALKTGLFPVAGYGTGFAGHLRSLFLPSVTLALTFIAVLVRALRASLIEVLDSDYILVARMKRVPGMRRLTKHVLRAAVPPVVTLIGVSASFLIGGTVIVENIFALPGLGRLLVNAMLARDLAVVQGVALVIAVGVVVINLVVDVIQARLDPRITAIG